MNTEPMQEKSYKKWTDKEIALGKVAYEAFWEILIGLKRGSVEGIDLWEQLDDTAHEDYIRSAVAVVQAFLKRDETPEPVAKPEPFLEPIPQPPTAPMHKIVVSKPLNEKAELWK